MRLVRPEITGMFSSKRTNIGGNYDHDYRNFGHKGRKAPHPGEHSVRGDVGAKRCLCLGSERISDHSRTCELQVLCIPADSQLLQKYVAMFVECSY